MKEIKKIKIWPFAKMSCILGAAMGLIATVLGILALPILSPEEFALLNASAILTGVIASIATYGIIGLIAGALLACLYNFITRYTKGIEIELK